MIPAVDIALRASLVVLVALVASTALRRRSAALRHWILAAGIFAAAAVAPLGRALPSWDVAWQPPRPIGLAMAALPAPALPRDPADVHTTVTPTTMTSHAGARSVAPVVNTLWALGALVAAGLMVRAFARLARVIGSATAVTDARWIAASERLRQQLRIKGPVTMLKCDRPGLVGTYGWLRPRVLLPPDCESWNDDRIRIVLGHELTHIRRSDWIVQVASDAVRAVFWYNPLFWIAGARLRSESEQACDDAVLDAGVSPTDYAAHLLALARACPSTPAVNAVVPMARRSTLERRITAMLNTTLAHNRPTRGAVTIALVAIAAVTAAAASFRASAQIEPRPLTGTVYDMTGAVLPQVAMTLADASGVGQTVATDRYGRFELGVVPPGRYRLSATLIGFQSVTQEINLREAGNWDRAITLHVGTLQETITARFPRPASAPPRTEPPIGGNIRAPMKTRDVRPDYPQALREAGVEGVVPLGAFIGTDGSVAEVRVLTTRAHPDLASAAIDAVRQWRFTPTLLNGEAIEIYMTVTVRFSLVE
jgi:TonB family protein